MYVLLRCYYRAVHLFCFVLPTERQEHVDDSKSPKFFNLVVLLVLKNGRKP